VRRFAVPKRSSSHASTGQSLAEFALILPVLLLIVLFAIDFGRALYGWVILQNSTRIAANYAALYPEGWRGSGDAGVVAEYEFQIGNDLSAANCTPPGTLPSPVFVDGPDTAVAGGNPDTAYDIGDTVVVEMSCSFAPMTPIISAVVGNSVQLAARSEFRIRAGDLVGLADPTQIPPPANPTPTPTGGSPTPTPTPTPPSCIVVPNLADEAGGQETVAQARSEWQAAGFTGSFSPNGQNNRIVLTQSIAQGQCVAPSSSITVTHT